MVQPSKSSHDDKRTTNTIRLMSWNIGSFIFLKYGIYFGFGLGDSYEYFLPDLNGKIVSDAIQDTDPDFLYLQEFWHPEDAKEISILKEYPHQLFLNTWYRNNGALIASKKKFSHYFVNEFLVVECEKYTIIPIHLNSFKPSTRLYEIEKLTEVLSAITSTTIVIGDTNIWSRGDRFLFSKDRRGYSKLTDKLFDASRHLVSTSYFGFSLDKVFLSGDLIATNVQAPKIRGEFMDHYPVSIHVSQNDIFE